MNYDILQGDCIETMRSLPSESVQCAVTSPPYFGLRSYLHNEHDDKHLEVGTEETPEAYVAKLVEVFREVRRLLHPTGTLWCNLGDSYNGSGGAGGDYGVGGLKEGQPKYPGRNVNGLGPKQLLGIPWRVAFALQADGWILRSDIIWAKPNPMPESVTDRPTKSHEYIFLLSKSREYYYDAEAIKEEAVMTPQRRHVRAGFGRTDVPGRANNKGAMSLRDEPEQEYSSRNRRSVWTVTTKPYKFAHFATFPPDLIEPCILAGTSAYGACAKCGAPWARVTDDHKVVTGHGGRDHPNNRDSSRNDVGIGTMYTTVRTTTGWEPTCTCNADVVPCVVLDPFAGAGTTLLVANRYGRRAIGCELNPEYIKLATERLDRNQPMLAGLTL